jgi:hypothetical protein
MSDPILAVNGNTVIRDTGHTVHYIDSMVVKQVDIWTERCDDINRIMGENSEKQQASRTVKTTVDLPQDLWRAAKIRAMDDLTDLRSVVIAALKAYLDANGNSIGT